MFNIPVQSLYKDLTKITSLTLDLFGRFKLIKPTNLSDNHLLNKYITLDFFRNKTT